MSTDFYQICSSINCTQHLAILSIFVVWFLLHILNHICVYEFTSTKCTYFTKMMFIVWFLFHVEFHMFINVYASLINYWYFSRS